MRNMTNVQSKELENALHMYKDKIKGLSFSTMMKSWDNFHKWLNFAIHQNYVNRVAEEEARASACRT